MINLDSWQTVMPLDRAEVEACVKALQLKPSATSPLRSTVQHTAAELEQARERLLKRGLLAGPGISVGPQGLALKASLEVLAQPRLELMVVKSKAQRPKPAAFPFVISKQHACLFWVSPDAKSVKVGPTLLNSQLFSILAHDLQGEEDFKPLGVLPAHYAVLRALIHAGLADQKKGFSPAALDGLLAKLKLKPADAATLTKSLLDEKILNRVDDLISVNREVKSVLRRLGGGDQTELVARASGAPMQSVLFIGGPGRRVRLDRIPDRKRPGTVAMISFQPSTQASLKATVGRLLGQ